MTSSSELLKLMPLLRKTAMRAGDAINEIRGDLGNVEEKSDGSPLTRADRASHETIVPVLEGLDLEYDVISEEGDLSQAAHCPDSFWLVDPLDGTKEFIKGLDDFTVNIALVINRQPALGVVYLPANGCMYSAVQGHGAWRQMQIEEKAERLTAPGNPDAVTAVMSRSHGSAETEEFLKKLGVANTIGRGSSLKMCAVAEGSADIYPRLNPTWYWDTAAGAAVAREAGCILANPDGSDLDYDLNRAMKHYGFILYTPKTCQPFNG